MAVITDDITIGQLTKRIRIEQQVKTPDGHGGHVIGWALRAVVWASVEPLSYKEAIQAAAVTSTLGSAVTIWYRSDLAITDRIVLSGRTLQIESYQDPTGGQVALRILCVEAQA